MKKYLMGTTAVIAATAFGGGAFAQSASEPIKLGLGGYWVGGGGTQIGTGGNANNEKLRTGFQQDSAIYVKGDTKFDNGLGVGVSVQFRGEGANSATATLQSDGKTVKGGQDTVKRSYVRFFGDFGEIRFGDDEDSRLQKQINAPQAGAIFSVNSPYLNFSNNPVGTNSTNTPIGTKRAQRLAYFSPTIAGFSFAASYEPQDKKGNFAPISFPVVGTAATAGQNQNLWSVAGLYDNKFGDFRLQASGGFTTSRQTGSGGNITNALNGVVTPSTATSNRSAWDGGLVLGWGPVQVGSSFEHQQNQRGSGGNTNTFDVGVAYTVGPFSTSLDWSRGYYKNFAAINATSILDVYEVIVDYVLGPGVAVGAAIQLDYYRSGVNAVPSGATNGNVGGATQNEHDAALEFGTHFTF
jgi:hypothetical protein